MKKKSPKKIIEETLKPEIEHTFIKYPGREAFDVTDYEKSGSTHAVAREGETYYVEVTNKGKPYTHIHTHPSKVKRTAKKKAESLALPSGDDFRGFLSEKDRKTMVVAVRDPDSGEVEGYGIVRKTRNTSFQSERELETATNGYESMRRYGSDSARHGFELIAEKYHLKHKMVPAQGYELNDDKTNFKKKKGLVSRVSGFFAPIFLILTILTGLPEITGNVIGINAGPSLISIIFLIISLILFYVSLRK